MIFLRDYVKDLKQDCWDAIFNGGNTQKQRVNMTATEVVENKDGMYNALEPYTDQVSFAWKKIVRDIAAFTDLLKGLELTYKFPSDFRLMSAMELILMRKAAKDAGAPPDVLAAIDEKILQVLHSENPLAGKEAEFKRRWRPFHGRSEEHVRFLMATGRVSPETEVRYNYIDEIGANLVYEYGEAFYAMTKKQQEPFVKKAVADILGELPTQTAAPVSFPIGE